MQDNVSLYRWPVEERADEDLKIGANVARMRAARSLSQAELAERIGVAQQTVAKIEKGTRSLKFMEARRICIALELPMALLEQEDGRASNSAQLIAHSTEMNSLSKELHEFAKRLAPALTQLAFTVSHMHDIDEYDRPAQSDLDRAASWLEVNWGEDLNDQIARALPTDDEIESINKDVDAQTYGEALARIARLKVEIHDSET